MSKLMDYAQKYRKIIYLIAAAVIIIISCYFGLQPQENWSAEKYGTTSDGQIAIKEDTELKVKFTISEDDFQGVFVRIPTTTRKYENEKLHFLLYNENSDLISEYTMNLKNELYNVDTMAYLPYKDSENKTVTLYIYGEDIGKIPYLSVSENSNIDSRLYVNGKLQKNVLVLAAAYMSETKINYTPLVGGGLFLIMLALVFFWPAIERKYTEENDVVKPTSIKKKINWLYKLISQYKKYFVFCILCFAYVVMTVFVYKTYVEDKLERKTSQKIVEEDEDREMISLNSDLSELRQRIYLNKNELSSLEYDIQVQGETKESRLHICVSDMNSGNVYHDQTIPVSKLNDGTWKILMQKEYTNSGNNNIYVDMQLIDGENVQIQFQTGANNETECKLNGSTQNSSPVVRANFADNDFLKMLYGIYCILIFFFLTVVYLLFIIKHLSVERVFIPVALTLGLLYMLVLPVYVVPDEYAHIDSAYRVSNSILGIDESNKLNYLYKRSIDINNDMYAESKARTYMYRLLYTNTIADGAEDVLVETHTRNAIGNASVLYYFPAAIGITIGRLLHLTNTSLLLVGRLFNLLVYVLLCYIAIRKIPIGKNLLFAIATLPIAMQEAASFSYDCIINGVAFVFLAYAVYAINSENKINTRDICILLFLTMQMALVKGGVYLPLCFIILLIPYERHWKNYLYALFTTIFILCAYMKNNIVGIIKRLLITQKENINGFTGGEMYSIGYLIKHPMKLMSLYINTIFVEGDAYIQGVLGGELGVFQLYMPWFTVFITLIVLILLCKHGKQSNYIKRKMSKIWIGLMSFGSVLLVCLSMLVAFTLKSYNFIEGVQGRYFMPILFLPFFLYKICDKKRYNVDVRKVFMVYYINHIIMLFCVLMIVFK